MKVLLIRHCSATGQHPEAPLSQEGESQALELAKFLHSLRVSRIVSSPFTRAISSASPLSDLTGISIEVDPRLAERALGEVVDGDWQRALRETFDNFDLTLSNGESSRLAQTRGRSVIDEAFASSHAVTAIFSHGNLLSLIANSFDRGIGYDFWANLSNPDVFELSKSKTLFTLQRIWK